MSRWPGVMSRWPGVMSRWPGVMSRWSGVMSLWPGVMSRWPGVMSQWAEPLPLGDYDDMVINERWHARELEDRTFMVLIISLVETQKILENLWWGCTEWPKTQYVHNRRQNNKISKKYWWKIRLLNTLTSLICVISFFTGKSPILMARMFNNCKNSTTEVRNMYIYVCVCVCVCVWSKAMLVTIRCRTFCLPVCYPQI